MASTDFDSPLLLRVSGARLVRACEVVLSKPVFLVIDMLFHWTFALSVKQHCKKLSAVAVVVLAVRDHHVSETQQTETALTSWRNWPVSARSEEMLGAIRWRPRMWYEPWEFLLRLSTIYVCLGCFSQTHCAVKRPRRHLQFASPAGASKLGAKGSTPEVTRSRYERYASPG